MFWLVEVAGRVGGRFVSWGWREGERGGERGREGERDGEVGMGGGGLGGGRPSHISGHHWDGRKCP